MSSCFVKTGFLTESEVHQSARLASQEALGIHLSLVPEELCLQIATTMLAFTFVLGGLHFSLYASSQA